MNQISIGSYIAEKRRALNLTQAQLAETLGVSNKTVSKWETGKCMPDYSVIKKLCEAIHITLAELMDGEDAAENSIQTYDEQILDLLRRTQELERHRQLIIGAMLIILGIASSALSATVGGSDVKDFMSGLLLGLSIVEMIAGLIIVIKQPLEK